MGLLSKYTHILPEVGMCTLYTHFFEGISYYIQHSLCVTFHKSENLLSLHH